MLFNDPDEYGLLEERLRGAMVAKYKNVRVFAAKAGVPYTTVVSMLKRGVMNASVGTVIKICRCLGISADALADGEIVPYEKSNIDLSPAERDLIEKYRALDERGRRAVDDTAERELSYVQPFREDSPVAT